jgi:hypothetical protein
MPDLLSKYERVGKNFVRYVETNRDFCTIYIAPHEKLNYLITVSCREKQKEPDNPFKRRRRRSSSRSQKRNIGIPHVEFVDCNKELWLRKYPAMSESLADELEQACRETIQLFKPRKPEGV